MSNQNTSEKRYLSLLNRYHVLDTKDESIIVPLWKYIPDSINQFKEEDAIYVPRARINQKYCNCININGKDVFYLNLEFDEKDIIRNKPTETAEGSIQNINQDINNQAEASSDKKQTDKDVQKNIKFQSKSGIKYSLAVMLVIINCILALIVVRLYNKMKALEETVIKERKDAQAKIVFVFQTLDRRLVKCENSLTDYQLEATLKNDDITPKINSLSYDIHLLKEDLEKTKKQIEAKLEIKLRSSDGSIFEW